MFHRYEDIVTFFQGGCSWKLTFILLKCVDFQCSVTLLASVAFFHKGCTWQFTDNNMQVRYIAESRKGRVLLCIRNQKEQWGDQKNSGGRGREVTVYMLQKPMVTHNTEWRRQDVNHVQQLTQVTNVDSGCGSQVYMYRVICYHHSIYCKCLVILHIGYSIVDYKYSCHHKMGAL